MAQICEFMAPMGAGKTTLIKSVVELQKNKLKICSGEELLFTNKSTCFGLRKFKKYNDKLFKVCLDDVGYKYKEFPEKFLESLMKNKLTKNGFNYIYKRFFRGLDNIAKLEYFRSINEQYIILIEDNFVRYSDILEVSNMDKSDLKKFSQITPLPDFIIFLKLNLEENVDRYIKRSELKFGRKLTNIEKSERFNTLKMVTELHDSYFNFLIEEYQIKHIVINGADEIEENALKINNFLNENFI